MFGWFKAKEPVKKWGAFNVLDNCNDCEKLEELYEFDGCCPKCGSTNYQKVIARWEYYWIGSGALSRRVKIRYEIKKV